MASLYCYKRLRDETIYYPETNVELSKTKFTPWFGDYREALYQKVVFDDASRKTYNHKVYAILWMSGSHEGGIYTKRNNAQSRSVEKFYLVGPEDREVTGTEAKNLFDDLKQKFEKAKAAGHQVIVKEW